MADYATLLRDHVTLSVWGIDRLFLQAYQPQTPVAWASRLVPKTTGVTTDTSDSR